ncbi:hypothetical protein RND71_031773 [Anisodus tanguticus]|uniref:TLDc domain-containing protein n=1 Tax=Anisodus tanguticus TaxID=243964 RepID=A0AAE1RCF3_9SOLA|nr:hypothetical protein RND71_031773 [Anisodus tanguticus]
MEKELLGYESIDLYKPHIATELKTLLQHQLLPSVGHSCEKSLDLLSQFMNCKFSGPCPDDCNIGQKLIVQGCEPLPRNLARLSAIKLNSDCAGSSDIMSGYETRMKQRETGQSSSSAEQREAESIAASTGAFSLLSDPHAPHPFPFSIEGSTHEELTLPKEFPVLLSHLSSSIVDLFFLSEKGGITWVEFLKGYMKCSGRTVSSASLNNLLRLFGTLSVKAGLPEKLQVVSDEEDSKISGVLLPVDLLMLLSMCWIMWWDSKKLWASSSLGDSGLPNVTHLVLSAIDFCSEADKQLDLWEKSILDLDIQLPVAKIVMWALKTLPSLADCFGQFVHARLFYIAAHEYSTNEDIRIILSQSSSPCGYTSGYCLLDAIIQDENKWKNLSKWTFSCDISAKEMSVGHLLNSGRAWALSLTLRGTLSEEISKACFPSAAEEVDDYLLYRSSLHGKGLNRFWSNVEGYNGPLLILISAHEVNNDARRWIIGVLIQQGLENYETFYGTSACRTCFWRILGNERIFVDEDFAKVTVRHHACDKTYHHGPLYPDQGYLPVEASVIDVEILGLGGKRARDIQSSYKKREELFIEQRRKVDLNSFGNWEDSPEKMMMDMVSDPNRRAMS